jgi:fibronectin-binding autotransporter adhesin
MALTKIKNISIDPDFRITGTEIDDTFTLTSKTVTVSTPTANTEAANKAYVDNSIAAVYSFSTIAVGGQTNVVADSAAATVTFVEDTGIIITTDANTDEITFKADATSNNVSNKLVIRDGSGSFSANVVTANLDGYLVNARDIQLTGDVTGTVAFDGSQNVQISTTIADSGVVDDTYGSATQVAQFVVDTRGIITSASNVSIAIPSTQITDFQEAVEDTYSASILAGTHASITFTYNDDTGALSSTFKNPNKFDKIAVSGQSTVEADSETDTVTFAGSTGLTITTNASSDTITFTNSGVTSAAVSGDGLSINTSTGAITITSNATTNNTPSTIVYRDASGNFTAGTITANVTGNLTGNVSGNVTSTGTSSFDNIVVTGGSIDSAIIGGSQPAAITGTTITANTGFTGDLTGNVYGNVTSTGTSSFADIDVTGGQINGTPIGNNSPSTGDFTAVTTTGDLNIASGVLFVNTVTDMVGINNPTPTEALDVVGNALVSGNITAGGDVTVTGSLTVLGTTTTVESTVTTLVDPVFTLGQGTYTSNDGQARGIEFKYYDGATRTGFFGYDTTDGVYKLLKSASNNNEVFTGTIATLEANLTGHLTNARKIELTSDVTGYVNFDGSQDVQISTTLANTAVVAGNYGAADKVSTFTVDSKGRLTAAGESQITIDSGAITDFDQAAQDAIGILIDNGTQTDIVVTYDAINHELNFSVPGAKSYSNFAVSGEDTVTANTANDTVTFAGSTGLTITTDAITETITFTNSGVTSAAVSGVGLSIDQSTGAITIDSNATSTNSADTIVSRDANGSFSAGTITASLSGNATSADKWSTSRTVTFSGGDVTGSFNIDGSGDVSNVALTVEANSVALGTDTTGDYVEGITAGAGIVVNNSGGEGSNPEIVNDDKGSDQEIFKSIIVAGQTTVTADTNNEALTIVAGTGVTITTDNTDKLITIENSGLPSFKYVAVDGQDTVVADQSDDTLTLIGGTAISISADPTTDAITFDNTGVTSFSTSGVGISVNASTGSVTLTSDATPNNDAGTIVSRDANGAFNAGDIGAENITADSLTTIYGVTVGTLTSGRVTFAGTNGLLSDDSDLTFNSTSNTLSTVNVSASDITTGGITVSDLTSGRVPFASTGGLLADSSNLSFNSGTNTLSTVNVSATAVTSTSVTDSGLTAGRVTFAGTGGLLSDDVDFTYNTTSDTLSAPNIDISGDVSAANLKSSTLTSGRVTFAGANGKLVDDADMTFDTATNTLSVTNVSADDVTTSTASVSSLTSGRVTFAGAGGSLTDDSVLTFGSGVLGTTDLTATGTVQGTDAKVTSLTATRVVFSDGTHKLVDDADMTFDTATNTLAVTNVESTQVVAGDLTLSGSTIASGAAGDLALDPGVGHFIDATTHKIINVVDPTSDQDASTKKYVDDAVNSITNLNIAADAGTDVIDITVDTLTLAGTVNQISTEAGVTTDTITISLPTTLIAPGSIEVTTTLNVTGDSTLNDVSVHDIGASGNASVTGTLDVTGLSTLTDVDASTLDTTGNVTVGGTLGVTGATTLSSTLGVTGVVTTTTDVNVGGDLDVTGATTVTTITSSGAATLDSVSVTNDLQVGGSVTIDGNLTVTGTTTSIETTNTQVTDNILVLNNGEVGAGVTSVTSGIEVDRGSLDNAQFVWNETTDEWELKVGTGYASLSLEDITVNGDATVNGTVTINNTVTVTGLVTVDSAKVTNNLEAGTLNVDNLTSTRVVFAGASGQLVDDADMTFDTATNTLSVTNVTSSSTVQGADVKATSLTSGRVTFAGTGGKLSDSGDLTFGAGTLTTVNVSADDVSTASASVSDLTSGRVVFSGTGGLLSDSGDLTFSAGTLSVTSVSATDLTASGDITAGSLTDGRVTFAGTGGLLSDSGDLTFNSSTGELSVPSLNISNGISAPSITDSGLTAGRVTFAGTGGLLSDDADLTFNSGTNTLSTINVSATAVTTTSLTDSALTAGRVTFATTGGELTDNANLSFNDGTSTLSTVNISASTAISSPSITDSGLTAGRITFAGTGGLLSDDSDLTYNSTTNTLSVPNASITNFSLGSLTQGRVVLVGTDGALVDDADVTYNTTTNTFAVSNIDTTDVNATGNVTVGGTLGVTGTTTLADATATTFDASSNVTVGGTLDVTGTTTLADATATTFDASSDVTVGGTLDVTGAVTMADTLHATGIVYGAAGFEGDLTGNVTGQVTDISNHVINDLSDVDTTGLQDQDTLRWDAATQQWVPSVSGGFQMRRQRFTANGTSPSFTLNVAPFSRDFLIVTVSGIPQAGDTFNTSGTTLTLGGTPMSGEIVEVLDFSTGVFSPAAQSTDDVPQGSTNKYYSNTYVQTLLGNGTLSSDIIPASNNNYDLGSTSKAWKNVYVSGSGTMTFGSIKIVNNSGTLQFLNVADDSYALVDLGLTLDSDISIDGGSY